MGTSTNVEFIGNGADKNLSSIRRFASTGKQRLYLVSLQSERAARTDWQCYHHRNRSVRNPPSRTCSTAWKLAVADTLSMSSPILLATSTPLVRSDLTTWFESICPSSEFFGQVLH